MKITSIKYHQGSNLWHGFATSDGRCLRWFWELEDSLFDVWEEEHFNGGRYFRMVDVEVPEGAKESVLRAIRASLS